MAQIGWDVRAEADLEVIESYIARDSRANAELYIRRLLDRIGRLADWPDSGTYHADFPDPHLRQILFRPYRIIYLFENDLVTIIKIHHGARLLDPAQIRPVR
jgi:toxin ParE1/3/4